ncbi:MAG: DUF3783 domain-containing protein [Erysipelotrichaceae bacterium]
MKKQILVYIPEHDLKRKQMIQTMKSLIDHVIEIKPIDFNQTLGFLSQREGFKETSTPANQDYPQAILIMDQLEDREISLLLTKLREQGTPFEGPKAIVTQHNQTWSIDALYHELMKEHEFFAYYDKINESLKRANALNKEDYEVNSWNEYQQTFLNAFILIKSQTPEFDQVKKTYEDLIEKEQKLVKIHQNI